MDTRPPGFSRPDFTPADIERTQAHIFAVQKRLAGQLSKIPVASPEALFPRWLTRLICAYIAAHTLVGLALLIAAFLAIVHFLPLIQKLPTLIQRISELAGVY